MIDTTVILTTVVDTLHPIGGEGAAEGTIITITTTIVMTMVASIVGGLGASTGGMTGDVAMIGMETIIEVIFFNRQLFHSYCI